MKFALALLALAAAGFSQTLSSDEIHGILAERTAGYPGGVGIVVGVIDAKGRRVVSSGGLNGDTVFEIGSVTKVFTSLLLSDMVQRGEAALTDPVAKYLPAGTKVPERGGRVITLQDLATHTSGLPRLPGNMHPKDPANPYADYTVAQLYEFLSSYELPRDIGSKFEYSNMGVGLLGHALARRAGMDYEALVRSRVLDPLGMKNTAITLSPAMKTRLAAGHDDQMAPAANWDLPTFAGAGALRSTADDMLTFVGANLGLTRTPLAAPMAAMLSPRRPAAPGMEIGLGWMISPSPRGEIAWHNGGTAGYLTFIGFDVKAQAGVVVLTNTFKPPGVDDIGLHLLDAERPLAKMRKEVTANPKLFDGFVGRYELRPDFIMTVTRAGDHLFIQATGQPRFEVFALNDRTYFPRAFDAEITFGSGELVLHQGGKDITARRIGDAPVHKDVALNGKVFDTLVGRYQLAPNFILTITREGEHAFAQATNQPKFEIFPEGDREYYLKVVDARITFDAEGKSLILHQNGANPKATRIN